MIPIKNTELIVIIFDVKSEDREKKQKKQNRINLRLLGSTTDPLRNNRKSSLPANTRKFNVKYPISSDHQSDRKLSILSHIFLPKLSK